jgi:hypothetical protein
MPIFLGRKIEEGIKSCKKWQEKRGENASRCLEVN